MKRSGESFFINRLRSVKYAFKGAVLLIKTEGSIQIQATIAVLVTVAGFFFHLSAYEWMAQFLAMGLVLVAESLNTGIEKVADFIHPEYNEKIGFIKDVSAGAAFFSAVIALIIGLLIYLPKIYWLI
jgi:diacylglycerol kinase (ATP)